MANFPAALDELFRIEGIHSNDSDDPGGDTYWGISEKYSRKLFEKVVGPWPPKNEEQAAEFYLYLWSEWDMEQYPEAVSTVVFPFVVNLGWDDVGPALQRAAQAACSQPLLDDGDIGRLSRRLIRIADQKSLIAAFRSEIAAVYRHEKRNPKYLHGWLQAAYGLR